MKKRLFVLLMAGLLLVSMTACGGDDGKETDTGSSSESSSLSSDPLGSSTESTSESGGSSSGSTIDQTEADFTDSAMTVSVYANKATLRKKPVVSTSTFVATTNRGDVFTVTGESTHWFRVEVKGYKEIEDGTYYLAKNVAGDKAVLDAFEDTDPVTMTVTGNVNLRLFPSADNDSTRLPSGAYLTKDSKVTCIGESNGWSKVLFQSTSDGDEEPQAYYVSSKYLKSEASSETESTSDSTTEASGKA